MTINEDNERKSNDKITEIHIYTTHIKHCSPNKKSGPSVMLLQKITLKTVHMHLQAMFFLILIEFFIP